MSHYIHLSVIGKSRTATFSLYFLRSKWKLYYIFVQTCIWCAHDQGRSQYRRHSNWRKKRDRDSGFLLPKKVLKEGDQIPKWKWMRQHTLILVSLWLRFTNDDNGVILPQSNCHFHPFIYGGKTNYSNLCGFRVGFFFWFSFFSKRSVRGALFDIASLWQTHNTKRACKWWCVLCGIVGQRYLLSVLSHSLSLTLYGLCIIERNMMLLCEWSPRSTQHEQSTHIATVE